MRLFLLLALLPLLVACTGADDDTRVEDPAGGATISDPPPRPGAVPPAPGEVVTRGLVTVLEKPDGTVACLGAVAESAPPQCDGPPIAGWDWARHGRYAERTAGVHWGQFSLRGTWDGTILTLVEAVPAALFDPRPTEEPVLPAPAGDRTPAQAQELAEELGRTLPGAQGAFVDEAGRVLVDVSYDDGSLQEWVDDVYGDGVVVVTGQLVDV